MVEENDLFCLIKASQWVRAGILLRSPDGPTLARQTDSYNNTPLHVAIGYNAPDDFILQLLHVYPDATKVRGTDYWTPLRVAAMCGTRTTWLTSDKVIEALIRAYPDALEDSGCDGVKGRAPSHFSTRFPKAAREMLERSVDDWRKLIEETKELQK